ncbi:sedoheptulokinase [Parablautia muri]|uniref:Glycerol kinase n=1 Tax=Parablautia muri TaxID=2320879 RepID=A0A9X5BDA8_9FIRM|nr:FGGY family carbohydrate kinase [Parablautia muri]NBJ91725.1 hypothetical protein [Parablautia muri]
MKAIGIDIGTTTISAVVLDDVQEKVLDARTIENGSFIHTEHEWERIQDVDIIIEKAKNVLDELLQLHPDAAAIGLTGQMHGILYVDSQGKCCSPLYTWQDQRGNLTQFDGLSLVEWIRQQSGAQVFTGYGLVTYLYQCKKGLLPEKGVSFCTISDYLGMVMTGRKEPLLHISMASSLGFFDGRKKEFQKDKLNRLGMHTDVLPKVSDAFSVIGTYQGRPVTIAIGDNQASFLGAVGFQKNTVLLNVGTGAQVSVMSDRFFETDGIEARPLTEDKFLLAGSSLCGGRAYAILENFFRSYMVAAGFEDTAQYDIMEKLAGKGIKMQDGMVVTTTFNGTRTDPALRGSIGNISKDNFTPQSLIYGVLRGIAGELYDMFEVIQKHTGIKADELIASGNGVRKNTVLQYIFEEMFGASLHLAKYKEEAASGAAISSLYKRKRAE